MAIFKKSILGDDLLVPIHVGVIMDGNGRWAKKRGLPRKFGHREGAKTFRTIARHAKALGVSYITFYAFSTENWKRPQEEVKPSLQAKMQHVEEISKDFDSMTLVLAINYGGRDEITYAVKCIADDVKAGKLQTEDIDEKLLQSKLYTEEIPDVDLIIRPSGEQRLSNFLIWQSAYAEYYFTNILWPDFSKKDLEKAVLTFSERNRRFGGV